MTYDAQLELAAMQRALKRRLTELVGDAQAEKNAGHTSKLLGLTSMLLGGFASVTTGGLAAIPLTVGAAAYLSGVMGQSKRTGRTMLLPFNDTGLGEILGGVSGERLEFPDLEDYAYMSTAEKSEYAMILCCGNRIAHALAQLPSDEHRHFAYTVAKRRFFEMYSQHIKRSPEILMSVDAAEVAQYILADEDEFKVLRSAVQSDAAALATQVPAEQPQPAIGPVTRLTAVEVPAAPVQPPAAPSSQWDDDEPLDATQGAGDMARLRDALSYPAVLIFGASGAGKSTLARWFIHQRLLLGHSVEILDPHVAYGQWEGLPVYGAGLDYETCNDRLGHFADLVQSRYQKLATQPNFNPRPHTLLTEEFTQWADKCSRAADFFKSSMSDLRKVNMLALYVAHGKTLTLLGGSKGTAQQRDASLLMIELDAKIGPEGKPIPSGRGRIYYPGQHSSPVEIVVPNLAQSAPAATPAPPPPADDERAKLEALYQQEPETLDPKAAVIDWEYAGRRLLAIKADNPDYTTRQCFGELFGRKFENGGPDWQRLVKDLRRNIWDLPQDLAHDLRSTFAKGLSD